MSTESGNEKAARINSLSERVIGGPAEVDASEAEELLNTGGVDPMRLKESLYLRMLEKSEMYLDAGKPLPPLLRKALKDLRSSRAGGESVSSLAETPRRHVAQLLKDVENLPKLLDMSGTFAFMAAYRKRAELSARDKETLDNIAEDLRRKIA